MRLSKGANMRTHKHEAGMLSQPPHCVKCGVEMKAQISEETRKVEKVHAKNCPLAQGVFKPLVNCNCSFNHAPPLPKGLHTPTFKEIMERIAFHVQAHEDVELLRTRFNAHEELVHSVEDLLDGLFYLEGELPQDLITAMSRAKQALAKAEGRNVEAEGR